VIYAHTVEREGRRVITTLVIHADPWPHGVTAASLKALPLGWIEAVVNSPTALKELAERDTGDPKADPVHMAFHDMDKTFLFTDLPHIKAEAPRLTRPDGTDPETFYRRVAEAYTAAVAKGTRKVAPTLAAEAGVPVPTVHRWIAEARRRGFLPPARKGRAG